MKTRYAAIGLICGVGMVISFTAAWQNYDQTAPRLTYLAIGLLLAIIGRFCLSAATKR